MLIPLVIQNGHTNPDMVFLDRITLTRGFQHLEMISVSDFQRLIEVIWYEISVEHL